MGDKKEVKKEEAATEEAITEETAPLKDGDKVKLRDGREGRVMSVRDKQATVQIGTGEAVDVDLTELELVKAEE